MKTDLVHTGGRPRKGDPIPLEEFFPASRRHPTGSRRCQAVTWRDGEPRQCRRRARDGFAVCSHHGAGSRKREIEGKATNPALASLKTGARAKESTLRQLWQANPALRALYEQHLESDDLLDMRPVLAQARALADWIVQKFDPAAREGESGPPLAFRTIQSLASIVRSAREMIRIEAELGPVTHADMRRVTDAITLTIRQFVPAEQREQAIAFLREQVGRRHRGPAEGGASS